VIQKISEVLEDVIKILPPKIAQRTHILPVLRQKQVSPIVEDVGRPRLLRCPLLIRLNRPIRPKLLLHLQEAGITLANLSSTISSRHSQLLLHRSRCSHCIVSLLVIQLEELLVAVVVSLFFIWEKRRRKLSKHSFIPVD